MSLVSERLHPEVAFGKTWKDTVVPNGVHSSGNGSPYAFAGGVPFSGGDLEVRVHCLLTGETSLTLEWVKARINGLSEPVFQCQIEQTTVKPILKWSGDGASSTTATASAASSLASSTVPGWFAFTLDVSAGSARFYEFAGPWDAPTALSDWSEVGTAQVSGATSILSGPLMLELFTQSGSVATSAPVNNAVLFEVQVFDGLQADGASLTANPRFSDLAQYSIDDTTGPAGYGGSGEAFNAASPLLVSLDDLGVSQVAVLPGQSGDYISVGSTNRLDADTAHIHQSIGGWTNQVSAANIAQSTDLTPLFGSFHGECNPTGTPSSVTIITAVGTAGIPVSASTQYTIVAQATTDQADSQARIRVQEYDAGGASLGITASGSGQVFSADTFAPMPALTYTSHASAAFAAVLIQWFPLAGNFADTDKLYWDEISLHAGASTDWRPSVNIIGGLDLRLQDAALDRTPPTAFSMITRWTTAGNLAWLWQTKTDGTLRLFTSADGTVSVTGTSTVATGIPNMKKKWSRVVFTVDDGGGNRVYRFFTSDTNGSWVQLGATVTTAGATSIFSATNTALEIGTDNVGVNSPMHGAALAFEVRDGESGPVVLSSDFTSAAEWTAGGTTSTTDEGHTVTISQGSGGAIAQISDKSALLGTGSEYGTILDVDALDFGDNTDPFAVAVAIRTGDKSVTQFLFAKQNSPGDLGYGGNLDGNFRPRLANGGAIAETVTGLSDDTYMVLGLNRGQQLLKGYLDGVNVGGSITDNTTSITNSRNFVIMAESDGGSPLNGEFFWVAVLGRELTDAEWAELGAWDGTIATEPSWLRAAATFYWNGADPDAAKAYITGNRLYNLADEHPDAQGNAWVLHSPDSRTVEIDGNWIDLTTRVDELSYKRGRFYESGVHEAGKANIRFINNTRDLEPEYAGSAYTPNVIPGVPIRIRARDTRVSSPVWQGFVDRWRVTYRQAAKDSRSLAECSDAFSIFNRLRIKDYESEVSADAPIAWYKLDETSGTTATDSGSLAVDGTYRNTPTLGATGPITNLLAADFDDSASEDMNVGSLTGSDVAADFSVEFWINVDGTDTNTTAQGLVQIDVDNTAGIYPLGVVLNRGVSPHVLAFVAPDGATWIGVSEFGAGLKPTDNTWRHVICVVGYTAETAQFYVDGVAGSVLDISAWDQTESTGTMTVAAAATVGHAFFDGLLSQVAIYDKQLTPGRIAAHWKAATAVFAAETYDTRITNMLTAAGFGGGTLLDAGAFTLTAVDPVDTTLLAMARRAAQSEGGAVLIGPDGRVRGWNQNTITNDFGTSQFTINLAGDVEMTEDNDRIFSTIRITTAAGTVEVAFDSTSDDSFGDRELAISPVDLSAADASTLAATLLALHKDKAIRIQRVMFTPGRDSSVLWPEIRDLDLGERITVGFQPPGGGAAISLEEHIERISLRSSNSEVTMTYQCSPAS